MKKNILTILCVMLTMAIPVSSQVTIGEQKAPESFSVLELISNTQRGMRLPQLTKAQRDLLEQSQGFQDQKGDLARGLTIFNTDSHCMETWDGSSWISLCAPPATLEVNPNTLIFRYVAGGNQNVAVSTNQTGWTISNLESVPDWVGLSGIGTGALTVSMSQANNTNAARTASLTITTTGVALSKTVTIIQLPSDDQVVDNFLPATVYPYVGAFWRYNQTGERLIRIPRPTIAAEVSRIDGPWSATVIAGSDWIVLDTVMTTDKNVGWRTDVVPDESNVDSYENKPDFDNLHPVKSTLTSVNGTMSASSPQIYFRIGVKTPLASATTPPRYGMILLTFTSKGSFAIQRLWIRQGEAADYIMRHSDAIIGTDGYINNTRPLARKFLPCNTTWSPFNMAVPFNGGLPTKYPTQAGAYFQWMNTTNKRYAYPPTGLATPWNSSYPSGTNPGLWKDATNYSATYETCPSGFHRPSDGLENQAVPDIMIGYDIVTPTNNWVINSEMRQSLWLIPPQTRNTPAGNGNSIWGYYADGFFDRRKIYDSPTSTTPLTVVSTGNNDIAYAGRLFFNPYSDSNASIFLPSAGYRNNGSGALQETRFGYYWSSSSDGNSGGWALMMDASTPDSNGNAQPTNITSQGLIWSWGLPIRCVQNE